LFNRPFAILPLLPPSNPPSKLSWPPTLEEIKLTTKGTAIDEIEFALDLSNPFDNRLEITFSVIVEINEFDLPEFLLSENKFKSVPTPLLDDSWTRASPTPSCKLSIDLSTSEELRFSFSEKRESSSLSLPFNKEKHGVFTYHLLKAFQDTEGDISYGNLYDAINIEVNKTTLRNQWMEQTPKVNTSSKVINDWINWKI